MENGRSIALDVPGQPLSITFVSAPDSATLKIEIDGEVHYAHTLNENVKSGDFTFLVRNRSFEWIPPHGRATSRIVLTAEQPPDRASIIRAVTMRAAKAPGPVFLSSLTVHAPAVT